MNPLFKGHPLPPRRPANPVIDPYKDLDRVGLAAMLAETRSKVWPVDEMHRVVDERRPQGYPMPPKVELHPEEPREPLQGYTGPGFVGPIPGPEQWNLPIHMRARDLRGQMDPNGPMAEDEYLYWLNSLRATARPL